MYTTDLEKIYEKLNKVLAMIDPVYIDALLALRKKIDKRNIEWSVGGDLGEALKTIQREPDCVEILTNKKGAAQIFLVIQQSFKSTGPLFQTHKLDRHAVVNGVAYPVFLRSYYFEFVINKIKIKVYGDLQIRINDWDWGDKLEFKPDHVIVVGEKIPVVPLQLKYALYQGLGWLDRAKKIERVLLKYPSDER